jgi:hypothetical protein
MKFIEGEGGNLPVLELTRRNLTALLDKLDDPASMRTLIDPDRSIKVNAVEESSDEEIPLIVEAVEDAEHYGDRLPGEVYMPTSGEYR